MSRSLRVASIVIVFAALSAAAPGAPPAPADVHAWAREASGDLLVDSLQVWWRPVRGAGVAHYRVRWSTDPGLSDALERMVVHEETAAWMETALSLASRRPHDHQRIHVAVEALDAQGAAGLAAVATARAGERPGPRGDINEDGSRDLGDAVALLAHLFGGAFRPSAYALAYSLDVDGSGRADISDAVKLLEHLFLGGPAPIEAPVGPPRPEILLGLFYGEACAAYRSVTQLAAVESWQGKKLAVVNVFSAWTSADATNLFGFQLPALWNRGNVPLITWEPHPSSRLPCVYDSTPPDIEARIAAGEHDAFIRDWGGRLKTWLSGPDRKLGEPGSAEIADDRRAYLRPAHEMNGWWTPWNAQTGGNRPEDFVTMWRRIHGILAGELGLGPAHLQWMWCVNNVDADFTDGRVAFPAEEYYPGDAFTDWLALDGYNWGFSQDWSDAWSQPTDVFNASFSAARMLGRLKALAPGKPISIAEFGTTSVSSRTPPGFDVAAKSAWIASALNYCAAGGVRMVVYFNIEKETDWSIFGGARGDSTFTHGGFPFQAYSTWRDAVLSPRFVSTEAGNPRLINDDRFAGR